MNVVETDRLILRNFRQLDATDLFAYLHHPRSSCFASLKLADLGAAQAEVEARSGSDEHVAVCLRSSDRLIGDLFCVLEPPDTYSVGWNFNANFGGVGYASEAARALFDHLFTVKEARRLYAYVEDDNFASQRLCERLGMRQEGLFREFISFVNDDQGVPIYENTLQYAILRKEWTT
ncbi:GNAT family N-acetyltransferase [Segnochrobactraceae bacterium EtOH-i3]